jgi:hypothetical protein
MFAQFYRTISNAKIKTVKLTISVVLGYFICSVPYVFVQLYTVWGYAGSDQRETKQIVLEMASSNKLLSTLPVRFINWLFWLLTLNSCLNPWIYMAFNRELVHTLIGGGSSPCCCCGGASVPSIGGGRSGAGRQNGSGTAVSRTSRSAGRNKYAVSWKIIGVPTTGC